MTNKNKWIVIGLLGLVLFLAGSVTNAEEYIKVKPLLISYQPNNEEYIKVKPLEINESLLVSYQPDNNELFQFDDPFSRPSKPSQSASGKTPSGDFGIRYNVSYSFSDSDVQDLYGDEMSAYGIDATFDSNPTLGWMISLDMISGKIGESGWSEKLNITGFGVSAIFHSPRDQQTQPYGGLGFSSYSIKLDGSEYGYGSYSEDESNTGLKLLGGIKFQVSPEVLIGLQLTIHKIGDFLGTSLDSTTIDLGINFSF